MDFCGIQVGREVAADEVANDGRGKKGAKQSDSNICRCDGLILLAQDVMYLQTSRKEKTQRKEDWGLVKRDTARDFSLGSAAMSRPRDPQGSLPILSHCQALRT